MAMKKTILIVEDNQVNRSVLCKMLEPDGYRLLQAENGQAALDVLAKETRPVDLILLDIVMPVMDGYEFLRVMGEREQLSAIPVIIMTGSNEPETEVRCLQAGASDFLRKPFNPQLVRYRVSSMLRLWDNAMLVNRLEIDRLTGVYNKDSFYHHAEDVLRQDPDGGYTMLYADIEDFKLINAHYGKQTGDELLRYLADILKKNMGEGGVCGRIGSDLFAVLVKGMQLLDQGDTGRYIAERMQDAPVKGVSVKFGIYQVQGRELSIADMCDRAKLAKDSIRHQYGVYYAVYDESMQQNALREHQLANYMEDALERKQFLVYLQPKHSTETGAVAGAEALVRWMHPELGFISPGEFIPLFEKNGFIVKLDYFVWREVCRLLRDWLDAGLKPVPVSVNASRADFLDPDLPERISDLVEEFNISPDLLHIEVTESAYTDNPQQIISAVSTLRDMGFEIEMDDFGSGYSSLNMLSELPIDILKLDMRFMQTGNDRLKASKRNILSFIVSLSKWMQLPTVAEGVETSEEFDVLKSMGCDLIQGYFFSKPMPIGDFAAYMQAHAAPAKAATPASSVTELPAAEDDGEEKPLVLVVEDIEGNREVMKALLSRDYRIDTAENGQVAYDYILEHSAELSCILLDLLMPVMDGFQLLEKLHADQSLSEIPVIITTETGSNGELRALNLGAHSFVAKPYNPDVLRHHVRKVVEEKNFRQFKRAYEKENLLLHEKAYRDELTGLLNRYGLKEAVRRLPAGMTHTVALLDVDNLKAMNDTYGHAAGDALLKIVAAKLRACTREGDALARIGGDEFIVVLRSMSDPEIAMHKVNELCKAIAGVTVPGTDTCSSCSAGVAMLADTDRFEEDYREADAALYAAKHEGRGGCRMSKEPAEKEEEQ